MAEAERALRQGDLGRGAEAQKGAVEALERARERLAERARTLREQEAEAKKALAEAQRRLREETEKAREAAAALAPKTDEAKAATRRAAERLEEASRKMAEAERSAGDASKAPRSQGEASEALAEASRALGEAAGETGDDAEARRRLKELKAEQERIQQKLKQLEDLLEKVENPEASQSAAAADQKMDDAEGQLEQGSGEKAAKSAEEARKYVEQAKEELERERRRYEALRQEEMLFRLVQDLKEFKKEQQRIRTEVEEISAAAAGGAPTRPQRKALKNLGGDEGKLRGRLDERVKAVREEGSPAFGTALEAVAVDVSEVARLLEEEQHDAYVRGLMAEVEHALGDLIGAFEDEIERRQKEGDQPPPEGQGQPGKPPLVPPMVEIKLLRRMQNDLNQKVETFWRTNPGVRDGSLGERERRTLERLYNQQGHIADDLQKLIDAVFSRGR
jgi:chromosome segregation ATPase